MRLLLMVGTALLAVSPGLTQNGTGTLPRVSGGVMAAQLLTKISPVYPVEAKVAHIQGVVVLHAVIGAEGTVKSLDAISGAPELRQAALDAVGQWTYRPYLLNGAPTAVDTTVTVRFSLADATADSRTAKPVTDEHAEVPSDAVRVSGGVMAGLLITKVNPTYPPNAKAKGVSGVVVVATVIGKDGTVTKLNVVSGPDDLRDSAVEAVRQWVYRPYLLNGKPAAVQTTVTVNFTLGG